MYDPAMGRFLSEDPTSFDGGDMNLYRYCQNNPVDRTDPSGLCSTPTFEPATTYFPSSQIVTAPGNPGLELAGAYSALASPTMVLSPGANFVNALPTPPLFGGGVFDEPSQLSQVDLARQALHAMLPTFTELAFHGQPSALDLLLNGDTTNDEPSSGASLLTGANLEGDGPFGAGLFDPSSFMAGKINTSTPFPKAPAPSPTPAPYALGYRETPDGSPFATDYNTERPDAHDAWLKGLALGNVAAGIKVEYPQAAALLEHFLNGSGTPFQFNFERMIQNNKFAHGAFEADLNQALADAESLLPAGTPGAVQMYSTRDTLHTIQDPNVATDYEYALHNYRTWGRATVSTSGAGVMQLDLEYNMRKNWQFGKTAARGGLVDDQEMARLNRVGYAQDFKVFGSAKVHVEWTPGQRAATGAKIQFRSTFPNNVPTWLRILY